jgi:hypothetical protein
MFFVEKYHPTLEDNTHWLKKFVFIRHPHCSIKAKESTNLLGILPHLPHKTAKSSL